MIHRKSTSNTKSKTKRPNQSAAKKFIFSVIKILLVLFIILGCAITGLIGGAVVGYIKTATPITDEKLRNMSFTSTLYDSKGKEISKLASKENREWVDYDKVPQYMKDAFVAIEDARFYEHKGVDIVRVIGVTWNMLRNPGKDPQGASTITQQLIKNITGENQVTYKRKIQEQWRALDLEKRYEKWQILEAYMNAIDLGYPCFGVQAAAKKYFNKDVSKLSLAECASIVAIANGTTYYNPLTTNGRKHNLERQKLILNEMLIQNKITKAEYDQARNEELKFSSSDGEESGNTNINSYFADRVVTEVKSDLVKSGYPASLVYNGGLKIYTTMDADVQKALDEVFNDDEFFPGNKKRTPENQAQAAMVIIDPKTGYIKGLYGGYGEKKVAFGLNRATDIKRQPGSGMKPIAVYGPAIDVGEITAATVIDDAPSYLDPSKPNKRWPESYPVNGVRTYEGLVTVRRAIEHSTNVAAVKVLKTLNLNRSFKYLKKCEINLDQKEDWNLAIALGGLYNGVSPLQMAAAYVPFANKGMYYHPTTYTRVEDSNGNVILEHKPKGDIVYTNEGTAYIMTSMMEGVCKPGGTAKYISVKNAKGEIIPVAGKTGTTSDDKDRWFIGYTPYYVGATWYGFDMPRTIKGIEGNPSGLIWKAVMNKVHKNMAAAKFPEAPRVVTKTICIRSGKIPTNLCFNDQRGNAVRKEYFIKGTEPEDEEKCDVHVAADICSSSGKLFSPSCPLSSKVSKVFIKRKQPYIRKNPDDRDPDDLIYQVPGYCNVHGGSAPGTFTPPPTNILPGEPTPTPVPDSPDIIDDTQPDYIQEEPPEVPVE